MHKSLSTPLREKSPLCVFVPSAPLAAVQTLPTHKELINGVKKRYVV
jgi:hypothetical protein